MRNSLLPILLVSSLIANAAELHCEFGFQGVGFLIGNTQLAASDKIGDFSFFNFQGTPAKTIPNLTLPLQAGDLFKYQLDEGFGENNITITVKQKELAPLKFSAVAVNPQSAFKSLQGYCAVQ